MICDWDLNLLLNKNKYKFFKIVLKIFPKNVIEKNKGSKKSFKKLIIEN